MLLCYKNSCGLRIDGPVKSVPCNALPDDHGDLVSEIETLRQGFKDALDFGMPADNSKVAYKIAMKAHHKNADRIIVLLGGESVYDNDA